MNEKNSKPSVHASAQDIEENKVMAAIGYISILCFVPLLLKKDSPYAQFHAKQGLALFIIEAISFVISWTVILSPVSAVVSFVCLLVSVYGIYLAMTGEQKEIPGVSHIAKMLNL
jgi:uncharacterized membrane protein